MIDDTMGEAIRADERLRLRARAAALEKICARHSLSRCDCGIDTYNHAIYDVLNLIDNPAPETTT
jgi:hypothetical protein